MIFNNKLIIVNRLLRNIRQLHCSLINNAYEGSGKTTLSILNLEVGSKLFIDKCTPMGFRLIDGSVILGPLIIFPKTILCWNVASGKYINEKSLSLFHILEPKVDIVVLGLETFYNPNLIKEMKRPLLERNITVEVLPVERACGVFNFLSEEGRYVAAGLIPPLQEETVAYKTLQAGMASIAKQKLVTS